MAKLIYSAITSLDGYIEDANGSFAWAAPDDEVHGFVNDLERSVGTYLYGRRMYETMSYWQTAHAVPDESDVSRDFAQIWQAAEKIVYSTTLQSATTPRTRVERSFHPEEIRHLKARAEPDLSVGGAQLAGHALRAGLVDEIHLLLVPAIVGAGKHCVPRDVRLDLELQDERRFASGVVYLRYRIE